MRARIAIPVVMTWSVLAACTDGVGTTPPPDQILTSFRTDSATYTWHHDGGGYSVRIVAEFVNQSRQTVYMPGCRAGDDSPAVGIVRVAGDTSRVFIQTPVRVCAPAPAPTLLAAGATRRDTIVLLSTDSPNASPPVPSAARVGQFQLRYLVFGRLTASATIDSLTLLPAEARSSNSFTLSY